MRSFSCPTCRARVFFTDLTCLTCGTALVYDVEYDQMVDLAARQGCAGRDLYECCWSVRPADTAGWCLACRLDEAPGTVPLSTELTVFQAAKRRVVRQLWQVGIDASGGPLNLRFALDRSSDDHRVTIGHADGLVTLDLAEADPVTREENRLSLGEPYRTPLGHVRHEVGHWHWQAFVLPDPDRLAQFRDLFGDETYDYADALQRHYATDDDGFWEQSFVSFYASAHPWEDYAESFAHVLHLLGTEETARSAGLIGDDPGDFAGRYEQWTQVTVDLNELARSMGTADPYPFAPSTEAVEKFHWVHDVLQGAPSTPGDPVSSSPGLG